MADEQNPETSTPAPAEASAPEVTTDTEPTASPETTGTPETTSEESTLEATPEGETADQEQPEGEANAKPAETPEVAKLRNWSSAVKRREEKVQAQLADVQKSRTKIDLFDELVTLRQEGKIAEILGKIGVTDEQLTKHIGSLPDPNDELGQLRARIDRQEQTARNAELERKIETAKTSIVEAIKTRGDEFEALNRSEDYGLVFDYLEAYHQEHGKPADPRVAAAEVERGLREYRDRLNGNSSANRGAKPATSRDTTPTAATGSASAAKPKVTTLTNTGSGRTPVKAAPIDLNEPEDVAFERYLRESGRL